MCVKFNKFQLNCNTHLKRKKKTLIKNNSIWDTHRLTREILKINYKFANGS